MRFNFKYPNLAIFFLILLLTFILYRAGILENFVGAFGEWGYIGAFFAGMFFVSTFTAVPALAVLSFFAANLNILAVSLIAGIGAVIGDYLIFRFVKDGLFNELKTLFDKAAGESFLKARHIFQSKYFIWLGPVIGALIIASPFPDEIGIALLGIYKMANKKFIILSFILNTVGILFLLGAIKAIF